MGITAPNTATPATLVEAIRYFSDPDACLNSLIPLRWPNGITCPHCGSKDYSFIASRRIWRCKSKACAKQFSVKIGMRRILVEQARRKSRLKRGGDLRRIELDACDPAGEVQNLDIVALDDALTRFAVTHPQKAELVKLRFFAGMTVAEAASALSMSTATAERHWRYARAWLARCLQHSDRPVENSAAS